jgi:hypothetical protein
VRHTGDHGAEQRSNEHVATFAPDRSEPAMAKLDARDRVRLVIVAYEFGLVPTGKK